MEGNCDAHDECLEDLFCGSNNCPASLGFESEVDCCYQPILGDEHFCSSGIPCGEDEGDCDSHDECKDGLSCGSNNCMESLSFNYGVDCCASFIVNCGGHYATFCHECPNGNGASWCNGDCEWNPTLNECQIKGTESDVSCGGHFATTCEDCPSGNGASWCNGDCEWNSTSNECHIKGTIGCNK